MHQAFQKKKKKCIKTAQNDVKIKGYPQFLFFISIETFQHPLDQQLLHTQMLVNYKPNTFPGKKKNKVKSLCTHFDILSSPASSI